MATTNSSTTRPTTTRTFETTNDEAKILIQILASTGAIQSGMYLLAIITSVKIRRKITFIYVINLLFAQLLLSTITVPMYCFAPHHVLYPYVTALTIIAYTLNLCTVTHERYLAICKPYRYSEKVSYSKAVKNSILCWIVAAVVQLLPIFWQHHPESEAIQRVYLSVTLLLFFIVPLIMIWLGYGQITYEIYKLGKASDTMIGIAVKVESLKTATTTAATTENNEQTPLESRKKLRRVSRKKSYLTTISNRINISRPRKEFQLAAVFLVAAIVSNITWVPVIMMVFLQIIGRADLEPENLSRIHIYLLVINANVDPLIYGMFLKPLRSRLFELVFGKTVHRDYSHSSTNEQHRV